MRRGAALAFALLGMLVTVDADGTSGTRPQAPPPPGTQIPHGVFEQLYLTYAAGDFSVVARTLRTEQDYLRIRRDLYVALPIWKTDWKRIQAAFLLEASITAFERAWADAPGLMGASRQFLVDRPDIPGADPTTDAFEILWHKTALGVLHGALMAQAGVAYGKQLSKRVGPRGPPPGETGLQLVEPRFALAAAIAQEQLTSPGSVAQARRSPTATLTLQPLDGYSRRVSEEAVRLFDEAAAYPENRAEASIRKAFLLHRLERFDEALALLDSQAGSSDPVLGYLAQLFRGRTLDKLNRREEAIAAYILADKVVPGAQTPAVELAVLNLQLDHRDAAVRWASRVRQNKSGVNDPWWQYWRGDIRFVEGWLREIRRTAQ